MKLKKPLVILLALALCLSLCACGKKTSEETSSAADTSTADVPNTETTEPEETSEPESTSEEIAEPEHTVTEIALNETIQLDFAEITFTEWGIAPDIRQSIQTENVTRTTGPQPEEGMQYVYLRGTIKNLNTEDLPVYDFFLGEFDLGGYKYDCSANECDVLTNNGERLSMVAPLTSGSFTMYAKIPDELAGSHGDVSFRFGFYDLFDNIELSKNRSFEDDPISLCQYQYAINGLQ